MRVTVSLLLLIFCSLFAVTLDIVRIIPVEVSELEESVYTNRTVS
jgi:hypothetical protein